MSAWRYGIHLLVLRNSALVRCAHSCDISQHSKINSVSPNGHVISSIYPLKEWGTDSNTSTKVCEVLLIYRAPVWIREATAVLRTALEDISKTHVWRNSQRRREREKKDRDFEVQVRHNIAVRRGQMESLWVTACSVDTETPQMEAVSSASRWLINKNRIPFRRIINTVSWRPTKNWRVFALTQSTHI